MSVICTWKFFSLILFLLFSSYQGFLGIFQTSSKFNPTKFPRNSTWYSTTDIRTGTVFHIDLQTHRIFSQYHFFYCHNHPEPAISSELIHLSKTIHKFQRLNKMTDLTSFFTQKCHPSPGDPLDRPWWRRTEPPFPHPHRHGRR